MKTEKYGLITACKGLGRDWIVTNTEFRPTTKMKCAPSVFEGNYYIVYKRKDGKWRALNKLKKFMLEPVLKSIGKLNKQADDIHSMWVRDIKTTKKGSK